MLVFRVFPLNLRIDNLCNNAEPYVRVCDTTEYGSTRTCFKFRKLALCCDGTTWTCAELESESCELLSFPCCVDYGVELSESFRGVSIELCS